jgi:hypothetical protein
MPTILKVGPYNFIFFSSDRSEPPHIHVKRDRQLVKYWLSPVTQDKNRGFKDHELRTIAKLVEDHRQMLLEAWNDYFDIGS